MASKHYLTRLGNCENDTSAANSFVNFWKRAIVLRHSFIVVMLVFAVVALPAGSATGSEASAKAQIASRWPPTVLHFCAAHCATWYLTADHEGYAGAPNIGSADPYGVKIVTFNRDSVVLNRTDPPNQWFPQGLKATITGNVSPEGGSLKDGKIHWTFGQSGAYDMRLTWGHALDSIPGDDNYLPPVVLHFCAAHCATWYLTLDRKGYSGVPKAPGIDPDGYGVRIVRFTHDAVELDRSDPPNQWFPQGLKAVLTGQVSPTGNGLINGKIRWTFGQSGLYDMRMSWGTGLDAIPGQDGPTLASGAQGEQLLESLFLLFLMMPDDSSSPSSTPAYRNPCAGVYSAACGTERRQSPRN
jgi:hypothetical protein